MPTLKEVSIALGLLTSDYNPVADADGWKDYVWRVRPAGICLSIDSGFCKVVQDKWDWKRSQFYEFSYRTNEADKTVTARVTLRNDDPKDDDHVCIVASFQDETGEEIGIFYANWRSLPGRSYTRDVPLHLAGLETDIATIAIGSKQCDPKAGTDAKNFMRVRTKLGQR
jgi:hypothetical protein